MTTTLSGVNIPQSWIDEVNSLHKKILQAEKQAIQKSINAGETYHKIMIDNKLSEKDFIAHVKASGVPVKQAREYLLLYRHQADAIDCENIDEAFKLVRGIEAYKKRRKDKAIQEKAQEARREARRTA